MARRKSASDAVLILSFAEADVPVLVAVAAGVGLLLTFASRVRCWFSDPALQAEINEIVRNNNHVMWIRIGVRRNIGFPSDDLIVGTGVAGLYDEDLRVITRRPHWLRYKSSCKHLSNVGSAQDLS